MRNIKINISTIDKVKSFVNVMQTMPFNVMLSNGVYIVDAKSIMGIFSLDVSSPLYVYPSVAKEEYDEAMARLSEVVKDYVC